MKIHKVLVDAVINGLIEIFFQKKYADKVVEQILKSNSKWGARDRAFIAENIYDCVRWWKLLWYLQEKEPVEHKFFISQTIGIQSYLRTRTIPEYEDWKKIKFQDLKKKMESCTDKSVLLSVPEWMLKINNAPNWESELKSMNEQAKMVLRINNLKTNRKAVDDALYFDRIQFTNTLIAPNAMVITEKFNVFANDVFKNGWVEVQDAGSQMIAPYLDVQPGMRVVDACAGAGGKSLHLADLMQNKGKIISMDTEQWKLDALKKRAKRNGVDIIETKAIDSTKTIKRLYETADRLLLDVPCSGIGVLRRNPDAKWKITSSMIEEVNITQKYIIEKYSPILKIGGKLVYATCSLLPIENEEVVNDFLSKNANFKLVQQQYITPAQHGFDGFYMALIERTS
jgi:16S rRNA (cytosine967-C5)-methyltransferase